MTVTINGTTGVSGVAGSASTPALIGSDADSGYYINSANEPNASVNGTAVWNAASTFGFKNRIINGAMLIDQRNSGATVTVTAASSTATNGYYLDRFYLRSESAAGSKVSVGRSTTAPTGFSNSQLVTSLTAYTLGASEHFGVVQAIEGYNTADLAWGTASAATVTLSFRVRSSLTGTFGGFIANNAADRCYVFSYTISAANTWETKTITIAGDTTGTWLTDNNVGVYVGFSVGAGSSTTTAAGSWGTTLYRSVTGQTSLVGTSGATFYITGVQFEKGSTATSFDYRPYGTELALCQRYYQTYTNLPVPFNANGNNGLNGYLALVYPVVMRAAPSASGSSVVYKQNATGITVTSIAGLSTNAGFLDQFFGNAASNPGYTLPTFVYFGSLTLSAEL